MDHIKIHTDHLVFYRGFDAPGWRIRFQRGGFYIRIWQNDESAYRDLHILEDPETFEEKLDLLDPFLQLSGKIEAWQQFD